MTDGNSLHDANTPGRTHESREAVPAGPPSARYETPTVEIVSLSCEISAYAPDEDDWPPF